mmetsp:Transcript_15269/g.38076  ORF Transcript_15269/g.38076 Transcript_15269/m.38076 type:complete len:212 (+) Transcript_15269:736-1371(+)
MPGSWVRNSRMVTFRASKEGSVGSSMFCSREPSSSRARCALLRLAMRSPSWLGCSAARSMPGMLMIIFLPPGSGMLICAPLPSSAGSSHKMPRMVTRAPRLMKNSPHASACLLVPLGHFFLCLLPALCAPAACTSPDAAAVRCTPAGRGPEEPAFFKPGVDGLLLPGVDGLALDLLCARLMEAWLPPCAGGCTFSGDAWPDDGSRCSLLPC